MIAFVLNNRYTWEKFCLKPKKNREVHRTFEHENHVNLLGLKWLLLNISVRIVLNVWLHSHHKKNPLQHAGFTGTPKPLKELKFSDSLHCLRRRPTQNCDEKKNQGVGYSKLPKSGTIRHILLRIWHYLAPYAIFCYGYGTI